LNIKDLGTGLDTSQSDGMVRLPWTPGDLFISFELQNDASLTLRASGTEPKLKYYLEVEAESMKSAEALAEDIRRDVLQSLLNPTKYGLTVSSE
jgi:phosphoglucomutase